MKLLSTFCACVLLFKTWVPTTLPARFLVSGPGSVPNQACVEVVCSELVKLIKNARQTVHFAVYGLRGQPAILQALEEAQQRGVAVEGVVDVDEQGKSYYADTHLLQEKINSVSTDSGRLSDAIMHHKFFVFDSTWVWTGSANTSDSCTGGYNVNLGIVLKSSLVASRFEQEFNELRSGRFGQAKRSNFTPESARTELGLIATYFSPQDRPLERLLIPALQGAEKEVVITLFYLTHRDVVKVLQEKAKEGVTVKIILDASAAGNTRSLVTSLRESGVQIKVENWGGKMHAKAVAIDRRRVLLGSMNWTIAGTSKNDENILDINGESAAIQFGGWFDQLWGALPEYTSRSLVKAEGLSSPGSCRDGLDNDYDGKIDALDSGCQAKE